MRPHGDGGMAISMVERGQKVAERVARQIVRDIVRRKLLPEQKLPPEADMISEYRVGRASLREGLRILEVHGLITIKSGPGGGPVVAAVDPGSFGRSSALYFQRDQATIHELVDARLTMEPEMARLAADRLNEESIQRMNTHLDEARKVDLDDEIEYLRIGTDFHSLVAELSGNRVLSLFSRSLHSLFRDQVRSVALATPDTRASTVSEHAEIAQAILDGDGVKAEELMREHMHAFTEGVWHADPQIANRVIDWV